jgi:adenosylcobinamide-phosphate synthase
MRRTPGVLLAAVALDATLGEPPPRLHPVVWMGGALNWLDARAPRDESARLVYGTAVAVGLPLAWGVLGWTLERTMPWPVCALALKATFAGRALLAAGQRVEDALHIGRLDQARQDLRWLVSRPTTDLDDGLVAAAAIESLAENYIDSWVAPLLAYACFGLGGAYAYRAANTADAMWGYRTPSYEHLGKSAAHLDDILTWGPARLGAGLLLLAGRHWHQALTIWRSDARHTASPNAGQAMAVAAGELGVRLEKRGSYALNAAGRTPGVADLAEARRLVVRGLLLALGVSLVLGRLRGRLTRGAVCRLSVYP